jgi:acetyl esterase/lipase
MRASEEQTMKNAASMFAAGACLMVAVLALAQAPPPEFMMKPMPVPADAAAIALYPGVAPGSEGATQQEQWSTVGGDQVARNVTHPTLTPYLPAKGKATGAGVVVVPGGGFKVLSMKNEGQEVARWLADHGIAAFLLKYRVQSSPVDDQDMMADMAKMISAVRAAGGANAPPPDFPLAYDDAQQALRLVRQHAAEWGVDGKRIGMVGFSAGAMTTLQVALRNAPDAKADFIGLIYGPMLAVQPPAETPPLFAAIAADDPLIGSGDFGLISSWRAAKASVELHYYERGGHGFGMRTLGTSSDLWIDEFHAWIRSRGLLGAGAGR